MPDASIPTHLAHVDSNPFWLSMSPERRQAILDGAAAMRIHRQGLRRVFDIGRAFYEMQEEARVRSNSGKPSGRRYSDAYAALEMPVPDLAGINKTDRNQYIWCHQNRAALEAWWALPENAEKRDKWNHPDAIKRNFQAYEKRQQRGADDAASEPKQPTRAQQRDESIRALQEALDKANREITGLRAGQATTADDTALRAEIVRLTAANERLVGENIQLRQALGRAQQQRPTTTSRPRNPFTKAQVQQLRTLMKALHPDNEPDASPELGARLTDAMAILNDIIDVQRNKAKRRT